MGRFSLTYGVQFLGVPTTSIVRKACEVKRLKIGRLSDLGVWLLREIRGAKGIAGDLFRDADLTGQSLPIFVGGRVCGSRR